MDDNKSTILLVDDDPMNLEILSSVLGKQYNLIIARGGKQALNIIQVGEIPNLVLLDIMMPDLDGYSVCTLLKSEEATKDIPIIFISAMGQSGDEAEGFNLGAVDYIKKPFVPAIVLARVETHLKLANSLKKIKELYSKSTIMNRLIQYKNHQIQMILNHSGEGYFVIDPDLIVQSEHSKECDHIFGFEIAGKNVMDIFTDFTGFKRNTEKDLFQPLFSLSDHDLEEQSQSYLKRLPKEVGKAGEVFQVRYSLILTENIGKRLLMVLKNTTERKQLQQHLDVALQKLDTIKNIAANITIQ